MCPSVASGRTGWELLGGLAAVGTGLHSAIDCQAALNRMHDKGAPQLGAGLAFGC